MAVKFSNNFSTFLSGGITASDTTITLQSVSGLPTLGSGDYTYLTIDSDTVSPTLEIVKVTAVNTGTGEVTVTRAQDGTTASSFSSGAKVELRLTAILLNDVSDEASTTDWPDVLNKPDPTLTITGDITGSATFTDLASASLTATASADLLRVDGDGSDLTDVRAETVEVTVKNVSGGSLAKGTPVHQTGTSGSSTFEVVAANASSASLMPAHFVLLETLADQAEGRGLLMGRISGVDTSAFSEGDTIYVAAGGGYTNAAPSGEGNLIQNLGTVTNVDATNGGGEVMGAGRSAATPNLNNGNIFIGDASNQATTASLSTSVSNAGFATTTYVDTAVADLVDSAPAALDTLNELAAALGDDANFSTTVTNSIALKQDASTALTTSTTFGGDVSGTYDAIVIADDSHNHVISNVDGLQTALDAKQNASTALTTSTTFGGDVSGTYNAIVVANDSHTHSFNNLTGKTSGTGDYKTTGKFRSSDNIVSGEGSGGVALTANDGYGNANVTWNHEDGVPEQTGNAARIEVNTDSSTGAAMYFELKSGVTGGTSVNLTNIMTLTESAITAESGIAFTGSGSGLTGTASSLSIGGNAATASKWATARTLSLTGAVTGSVSWDGSGNASLATTATSDPTLTLSGDASGSATFTNLGNATLSVTVANDSHTHAFNNLTSKTGGTGTYYTSGIMGGTTIQGGSAQTLSSAGQVALFAGSPYISFHPGSSTTRNGYIQKVNSGDYFFFGEESYVACDTSFRAPIFYDSNDTAYNVNPASTSRLNDIYLEGEIYHNGDTNTYIQFHAADQFRVVTGGTERLEVNNTATTGSRIDATSQMRSPIFYDYNNTAYYTDPASTSVLSVLRLDSTEPYQLYSNSNYLNIRYNAGGGGGIRLYDNGNVLQGSWYGNGSGEHGFLDNDSAWAVRVRTGTNPLTLYCNDNPEFYVYTSYTYSPGSSRAPIFYDSNNTSYYFHGDSTSDSIRVAGNIVAYYSDERLKTKLGNIDSPVEKVKALSGFKYRANETAEKLGYSAEKVEVGVSAQEVEAVLPEVVRDAPIGQGYKTVQYERLVPLLIEAIKEQAGQIEALQAEVAKLKG